MGKGLDCEREPNNAHDHYVVAVKRRGVVIDHFLRKLLRLWVFILGFEKNQNGLADYFTP